MKLVIKSIDFSDEKNEEMINEIVQIILSLDSYKQTFIIPKKMRIV